MKTLDARGLQCPQPLMMAKKELDASADALEITGTTAAAVANLSHLAKRMGRSVEVAQGDDEWTLTFSEASANSTACESCGCLESYAVFVSKDHLGEGDETLGASLVKMALYTLAESGNAPQHLLFMNSGVKLVAGGEQQIVDSVSSLVAQGTTVLVCGTCLDYYQLTDQLAVGEVSNMYDIMNAMQVASKVITL